MPDPQHKSVSASQVAALFGRSRFSSRWMLYQHFVNQSPWTAEPNARMLAGKYYESGTLAWAADIMGLEVTPYTSQEYVRHPDPNVRLGATIDAEIRQSTWGQGILEAKLIQYFVWKERWTETVPDGEVVIQLQSQLAVYPQCKWGAIACRVEGGSGVHIYRMQRDEELIARIEAEANKFMHEVENHVEPPVEGIESELDLIAKLYPERDQSKVLNISDVDFDYACEQHIESQELRLTHDKIARKARAKILGTAKDAHIVYSDNFAVYCRPTKDGKVRLTIKEQVRIG